MHIFELAKPIPPREVKGIKAITGDDNHPEPIDKPDPTVMGLRQIEEYMDKFDKELEELNQLQGDCKRLYKGKNEEKRRTCK